MNGRSATSPIRVALRLDDGHGPAYLASAAEAVMGLAGAEVVLIIATTPVRARLSARRRARVQIDAVYDWLERRMLHGGPAALTLRGPVRAPNGVPLVRGVTRAEESDAVEASRAHVLIDLSTDDDDTLACPPGGRWRLRYAVGVGGARLTRLTRPTGATALAESLVSIDLDDGSALEAEVGVATLRRVGFGRDRDAIQWRSSLLPARRLARLVAGEEVGSVLADRQALAVVGVCGPAVRAWVGPPFVELAATILRKIVERMLYRSSWLVLVRAREPGQAPPKTLSGFRPIEAPPGRFYADPFVVDTADGPHLYVEDCPDGAHRGRISELRLTATARWTFERVVLDDLQHRAYPHALRAEAGLLLSPDSGRSGGVDLFLDRGPAGVPKLLAHCLDGVLASDPTLLWRDGRYWLFVTVTGHGMSPWDELHLYSATAPAGPWHSHPRNPIVADCRRARPAGRIFRLGDAWIRPGQDCSVAYGQRIVLSAITTLTLDAYEERAFDSIEPSGATGVRRTHTYTFDGPIEAVDGYRRTFRWPRRGTPARNEPAR